MIKRYIAGFLLIAGLLFVGAPVGATVTTFWQYAPTAKASLPYANGMAIQSISTTGSVVTVQVASTASIATGTGVTVSNITPSGFDGDYNVTVTDGAHFTYSNATTGTPVALTTFGIFDATSNVTTTATAIVVANGAATITLSSGTSINTGDYILVSGATPLVLNGFHECSKLGANVINVSTSATGSVTATGVATPDVDSASGGTINGHFDILPYGPVVGSGGGNGWSESSAGNTLPAGHNSGIQYPVTSTQANFVSPDYWVYINGVSSASNTNYLLKILDTDLADCYSLALEQAANGSGGRDFMQIQNNVFTDTGVNCPFNQWIELRVVVNPVTIGSTYATSSWNIMQEYRIPGGSWVTIWTAAAGSTYGHYYDYTAKIGSVTFGFNGSSSGINGRWACPTLMTMTNFATDPSVLESTFTPAVNDPSTAVHQWWWDPGNATGVASDSNTGTTSSSPLLSADYVSQLSQYGGFFNVAQNNAWQTAVGGVPTGTALDMSQDVIGVLCPEYRAGLAALVGDVLTVNNDNGQEIRMSEQGLICNTAGLTIKSSGGATAPAVLSRFHILPASGWSLVSGKTYTYQDSDESSQSVLFENRAVLLLATSVANCEATVGSFYNDGTYMYVHPLGSTNPTSDNMCYERTMIGDGSFGGILQSGGSVNLLVQGITTLGCITCSDNGCYSFENFFCNIASGYCLTVFDTDTGIYGDKHIFASVGTTANNNRCLYLNCIAQGESTLGGIGQSTNWVDYTAAGTGNVSGYYGCSMGAGSSLEVGSNQFSSAYAYLGSDSAAWTDHGATGGISVEFANCNLPGGFANQNNDPISFNDCVLVNPNLSNGQAAYATMRGCTIVGAFPNATCYNCLFPLVGAIGNYNNYCVLNNCTIDYTKALSSNVLAWQDVNPGSDTAPALTLNECLILAGTGALITALPTNGTANYHSNYCEWQAPSAQSLVATVTNGAATLAQMQTQSLDTGSVSLNGTAASVTPGTYQRTAQSSLIKLVGPFTDFTGVNFSARQTVGAYEWVPAYGVGIRGRGRSIN